MLQAYVHSTQTCLVDVSDYLLDNMSSGHFTGAVFLDLKKAFDTVQQRVLIKKRYQVTKINVHYSNQAPVIVGGPQGSIIGSLFFTININDLSSHLRNKDTRVYLYADDTAIFVKGKKLIS